MGLVIVVILISLGMLFLLRFVVFQPAPEERAVFTQEQIAKGTLRVLLETKTDCLGLKMTTLIQDCAEGGNIECRGGSSCAFVQNEVADIFEDTLLRWNKEFEFIVWVKFGQNQDDVINLGSELGCPGERDQARQPVPDRIEVILNVCD